MRGDFMEFSPYTCCTQFQEWHSTTPAPLPLICTILTVCLLCLGHFVRILRIPGGRNILSQTNFKLGKQAIP